MSAEISRSTRRSGKRFVRLFSGTVAILAVVVGALTAANFTQGPRLTSAEINLEGAVARSGQRLLLQTNQPLVSVDEKQVTVEPKTDVTATVADSAITIQFAGILRYNTTYTVKVRGVQGTSQDATSTLEHSFTTPDSDIYSLQRDVRVDDAGLKLPDTIRRTTILGRGSGEAVFSAPRIQEYGVLSDALAVVTIGEDETTSLEIGSLSGAEQVQVPLPTEGIVKRLRTAASENLIAYTFTSSPTAPGPKYRDTPFIFDLAAGSGIPTEVAGLDGRPMSVVDLDFIPGTTSLVVQAEDENVFLLDALKEGKEGTLTPLGQHSEIRGFIPGTKELVVADPTQGGTIDLTDGTVTVLDLAESVLSDTAYPGQLVLLDGQGRYARQFDQESTDTTEMISAITLTDDNASKIVYQTASESSRVRNFCVSPNGQFLAAEIFSTDGKSDSYPNLPATTGLTIVLNDLETGASNRSISGFLPGWCR